MSLLLLMCDHSVCVCVGLPFKFMPGFSPGGLQPAGMGVFLSVFYPCSPGGGGVC